MGLAGALPDPPAGWVAGKQAHLLVGALAHSSKWRGVLADAEDFPHLVEALEAPLRRLGGAQAGLERLAAKPDSRRVHDGERTTVTALPAAERLHAPPLLAFPAEFDLARPVTPHALVAFRGNSYSVPPGLGGAQAQVRHRLGAEALRIVTYRGATVAVRRRAPDWPGGSSATTGT